MRNNIAAASRGHDTAIEQAMMAANAELAALRTFVDEVRGNDDSSKSISEWIKDRTNRVTYPFRRGHLDRLESQLLEANKALQSAIQATQLAISIETVNVTRSIGDEKGLQTLRWMFKSGKASPLDVDIDDGSLLYAATNGSGMQSASGLWKLRPFLEYLVAIGVPRDQPDEKMNELPFHSLFKWSAFRLKLDEYSKGSNTHSYKGTGFASVALDYQFLMPDDTSVISDYAASHRYGANSINMKFFREVARALPGMTEWYGNELHTAIIQKNEVKLVEILKKDTARATLWETDTFGCAALELLTCWTQGMQLVFFHWGSQILQDDNCQRLSMVKNFWFDNNNWKKSLDRLSNLMAPVLDGNLDVPEDFKSMAVRMATFEALSIHHTCCVRYGVRRDIDDEDIQEFLEEDSRAIEILHELLPEFEAKLVEMSCSFSEFLRTYWKERMAQVLEELNEPQPLTKDNLREIKRLGVDLRVEDEDVDKAGSECGLFEFYMAYLDGIMEPLSGIVTTSSFRPQL
ncbi:hypothetical protein CGMCC3_g1718 [Colletotrichum fructicola]|nr:uncharacterized protein CGMCC3_g1718 [Colletotrichum fructicola]KAE9582223.1 hypothetical protein CGMCC3_g1718 [Colletotrichum fructicola]